MGIQDEIAKAIESHAHWKSKLRMAIELGVSEFTPDQVREDKNCMFGEWLHHYIEDAYRDTPEYREIVSLHANFHKEAGEILELALNGNAKEADRRMKIGGRFSAYSETLIRKMRAWQESL